MAFDFGQLAKGNKAGMAGQISDLVGDYADLHGVLVQGSIAKSRGRVDRASIGLSVVQANINARLAATQARDVERIGRQQGLRRRSIADFKKGSQRASFAAQGVDVSVGSAAAVQAETELMGELDALVIQNNARRAAQGLKMEEFSQLQTAAGLHFAGQERKIQADQVAGRQTLLFAQGIAQHFGKVGGMMMGMGGG